MKGLMSYIYDLDEEEIGRVIKKYKKRFPRYRYKSEEKLYPFAVNQILRNKNQQ